GSETAGALGVCLSSLVHAGVVPIRSTQEKLGMNSLRCGIALALLAVFASAALEAQGRGTVTGSVTEEAARRPLPAAQVVIGETGLGALTDSRGRYQVLNVPAGQHTVRVQIIGYGEASQTVTVVAGEAVTADFALEETAVSLDRIVVTALGIE